MILNSNDSHYIFSSDRRSLSIIDLSTDDTGLYTLLAVNPAGVHSDSIYLDVQGICNYYCFTHTYTYTHTHTHTHTHSHTHAHVLSDSEVFNNILI